MAGFGVMFIGILLFFLRITISWHKRELALEVAARTAEAEKEAAIGRMAAQVAHDIRSPLASLEAVLKGAATIPAEQRELVKSALGRITIIAGNLLESYRGRVPVSAQELGPLIEGVLAEKRAQFASRPEIAISFSCEPEGCRAAVNAAELQRIISNLLNNAAEAIVKNGLISVSLNRKNENIHISISDPGRGIPPEVLALLGRKGETHGKPGGTGLGLYHARVTAESWGGSLSIVSAPGEGTTVQLTLPRASAPGSGSRVALIDDDPLVRMNWKTAARSKKVELSAFASPGEFFSAGVSRDTAVFVDSDLGDGVKGEELAADLKEKGYKDITLETGHPPEKFVAWPWLKVQGKEPPF